MQRRICLSNLLLTTGMSAGLLFVTGLHADAQTTTINNSTLTVPPGTIPSGNDLQVGTTGTGTLNIVTGGTVTTADTILGQAASGVGTINVTGGAWTNAGALYVGLDGKGTLAISAGGVVTTSSSTKVGMYAGSSGAVTLSGAGSSWTEGGSATIGMQGTGLMTVSSGALFDVAGLTIGSSAGSDSTFNLTGVGSIVNVANNLYIADNGVGTFNVTNGATLAVGSALYVGYSDGQGVFNVSGGSTVTSGDVSFGYYSNNGKGTANITGAGTTWAINGDLTLGDEGGAGEMNITSGAQVSATGNLRMGVYDDHITRGDLLITGAGSQLTIDGDAYIGIERPAIVTVSNGAQFTVVGNTEIARDTTAPSTVTVIGAGSIWNTDSITVGDDGQGTLNITNGGVVNTGSSAYVGYYGSGSSVTVSGIGSEWNLNTNDLYVGSYTDASVTVTNGGRLSTTGDITIGEATDGHGVVNVTNGGIINSGSVVLGNYGHPMSGKMNISGAGSEWHVTGDITAINDYGAAEINVTNGALLTATDGLSLGSYGNYPDDIAYMTVSGSGTRVEIGGTTDIGDGAEAHLLVTDGAQFAADEMSIGSGSTATTTIKNGGAISANELTIDEYGTLNFGAAAGDPAGVTGTLTVPTVTFTSGSGGTIVFNHTNNLEFGAALASSSPGYGDVQVLSGTTTFTAGTGAYSGDVDVTGGKAVFNANVGGYVSVSGNGVVGGSGTIGSLDVLSGGTVAPGNSPGTLNVAGNVTFAPGTTYQVEVAGAVSDLIAATGTATLNGGTVQVSGSPSLMRYTILSSTALTGTFAGIESASAFVNYSLDYDLLNAYLVIDSFNALSTAARTPNQYAASRALDQFLAGNPVYAAILGGSASDARQAFDALSGEVHASVGTTLADNNRYVREAITGRLIQAYHGGSGAGGGQPVVLASAAPQDVVEIDTSSRMSLGAGNGSSREAAPAGGQNLAYWSRSFGAWGQYDTNGNAATTDRNLGGFVTGVDGGLGGGWRAGLATGYLYTDLDVDARNSQAQIDSYVLGGYVGGDLGAGLALRSGGTWTWNDIDTSRHVVLPGISAFESANYNGDVGQLFAELAYPVFTRGGVIEPFAGLAYVHVSTDGFTERGSVAGLTSRGNDIDLGYGTLGARMGTTVVWGGTTVIPHVSLAWQYAFGDTTPMQALAFASNGIGMNIGGVPVADSSVLIEIGADAVIAEDATFGLSYIGQYSGDFTDSGLRARFNWKF